MPEVARIPKSDDVLHKQQMMIAALKASNRPAAHFWARCALYYRQRDLNATPRERDDWLDRCGWPA